MREFLNVYLALETYYSASKYPLSQKLPRPPHCGDLGELRGPMKLDWFVKCLLIVIALLLGVMAFRPVVRPVPMLAQGGSPYPFHIEQGRVSLRKPDGTTTWGKVVVDMRNGDVWGFSMKAQRAISRLRARRYVESLAPDVSGSFGARRSNATLRFRALLRLV